MDKGVSDDEMVRAAARLKRVKFVRDHVSNYIPINGKLPDQKEDMSKLSDVILEAPPK